MKKIVFLVSLIWSAVVSAQPTTVTGYTTFNERRNQLAIIARALHVPAGATPALSSGQWVGAGALYIDTTGGNKGLYGYWDGVFHRMVDTTWSGLTSAGFLSSAGSGYKIAVESTHNVKSVTATNGLSADSSTSGQVGIKYGGTGIENTSVAWSTFTNTQTWTNLGSSSGLNLTQTGTGTGNAAGVGNAVLRITKTGSLGIGQHTMGAYITNEQTGTGGSITALRLNAVGKAGNSYALIIDSGRVGIGEATPGAKMQLRTNNLHEFADNSSGIVISNDSSATPAYDQYSPVFALVGQRWGTALSATQNTYFGMWTAPVQGVGKTGVLQFGFDTSSNTFTNIFGIDAGGALLNASGSAGTAGQVLTSGGAYAPFTWGSAGSSSKATNSTTINSDSIFARKVSQNLTDGATITWDLQTSINADVTLGGNRTLAFSNIGTAVGTTAILVITQDGTGSRTLTLPASCKVVNGGAGALTLTTTAGAVDIVSFYFFSSSVVYVSYGRNFN